MIDIASFIREVHLSTEEEREALKQALTALHSDKVIIDKLCDRDLYVDISFWIEGDNEVPHANGHAATTPHKSPIRGSMSHLYGDVVDSAIDTGAGFLGLVGKGLGALADNLSPIKRQAHAEKPRPFRDVRICSTLSLITSEHIPFTATYNAWIKAKDKTTTLQDKAKQLVIYGILTKGDDLDPTLQAELMTKVLQAGLKDQEKHPQQAAFEAELDDFVKKQWTLSAKIFENEVLNPLRDLKMDEALKTLTVIVQEAIDYLKHYHPNITVKAKADQRIYKKCEAYFLNQWTIITGHRMLPIADDSLWSAMSPPYVKLISSFLEPLKQNLRAQELDTLIKSIELSGTDSSMIQAIRLLDAAVDYLANRKGVFHRLGYQDETPPTAALLHGRYIELDDLIAKIYKTAKTVTILAPSTASTSPSEERLRAKLVIDPIYAEVAFRTHTPDNDSSAHDPAPEMTDIGVLDLLPSPAAGEIYPNTAPYDIAVFLTNLNKPVDIEKLSAQALALQQGLIAEVTKAINPSESPELTRDTTQAEITQLQQQCIAILRAEVPREHLTISDKARLRDESRRIYDALLSKHVQQTETAPTLETLLNQATINDLIALFSIKQLFALIEQYREAVRKELATFGTAEDVAKLVDFSKHFAHFKEHSAIYAPLSQNYDASNFTELFNRLILVKLFHQEFIKAINENIALFDNSALQLEGSTLKQAYEAYDHFISDKKSERRKEKVVERLLQKEELPNGTRKSTGKKKGSGSSASSVGTGGAQENTSQEELNRELNKQLKTLKSGNIQKWEAIKKAVLPLIPYTENTPSLKEATEQNISQLLQQLESSATTLLDKGQIALGPRYVLAKKIQNCSDTIVTCAQDLDDALNTYYQVQSAPISLSKKIELLEEKIQQDKESLVKIAHLLGIEHTEEHTAQSVTEQLGNYTKFIDQALAYYKTLKDIQLETAQEPRNLSEKIALLKEYIIADQSILAPVAFILGIHHTRLDNVEDIKKQHAVYEEQMDAALQLHGHTPEKQLTLHEKIAVLKACIKATLAVLVKIGETLHSEGSTDEIENHAAVAEKMLSAHRQLATKLEQLASCLTPLGIKVNQDHTILNDKLDEVRRAEQALIKKAQDLLEIRPDDDIPSNVPAAFKHYYDQLNDLFLTLPSDSTESLVTFGNRQDVTSEILAKLIIETQKRLTAWLQSAQQTIADGSLLYRSLGKTEDTSKLVLESLPQQTDLNLTMHFFTTHHATVEGNQANFLKLLELKEQRVTTADGMISTIKAINDLDYLPTEHRYTPKINDGLSADSLLALKTTYKKYELFLDFIVNLKNYILNELHHQHRDIALDYFAYYGLSAQAALPMSEKTQIGTIGAVTSEKLAHHPDFLTAIIDPILSISPNHLEKNTALMKTRAAQLVTHYELSNIPQEKLKSDPLLKSLYHWYLAKKTNLLSKGKPAAEFNKIEKEAFCAILEMRITQLGDEDEKTQRFTKVLDFAITRDIVHEMTGLRELRDYIRKSDNNITLAQTITAALGNAALKNKLYARNSFWSPDTLTVDLIEQAYGRANLADKDPLPTAMAIYMRRKLA